MDATSASDVSLGYLAALEQRAPVGDIRSMFHEDASVEVLPNLLDRRGSRRTRSEACADLERGRQLLSEERYAVTSTLSQGEHVVHEVTWSGVLAIALGGLPVGATLRARCSMHFEIRQGQIIAQRNYDCFDDW